MIAFNRLIVSLLVIMIVLSACSIPTNQNENTVSTTTTASSDPVKETPPSTETSTSTPVSPTHTKATLAAVGDVLIHNSIYEDAETGKNTYDFSPIFSDVAPYLKAADLTFANSESIVGGQALGLSSYPSFNSPFEVGTALKAAGVDIVSMANNHALDKGEKGIENATTHWKAIGMDYVGAYQDQADADHLRIIEKNGIRFAFLAYTYGTNGIPLPKGKEYLVNLIDKDKIKDDIQKAKPLSDVVVVSFHFGTEYQTMPTDSQKDLVQFTADQGADIILGSHPHVLQPVQWVTGKDGHKAFVIYSLGNFIAAQETPHTRYGGILELTVEKTTNGDQSTIQLTQPEFLPTYIQYQKWRQFKVLPMVDLTDNDLPDAKQEYESIKTHMTYWVKDLQFIGDTNKGAN